MQSFYRGVRYNPSTPTQSAPSHSAQGTSPHNLSLSYRGTSYRQQPQTAPEDAIANIAHAQTVTLMYRGQPYQCQLTTPIPTQQSSAQNWHWQTQAQA